MKKTEYIYFNDKFVPWDEAYIHCLSHTLHYGSGAFEGIRTYKTKNSSAIFILKEHMERLIYSASALGFNLENYPVEKLCKITVETLRKNNLSEGYIRPLFFFGYGSLGVAPKNNPTQLIIACWPWDKYLPVDRVDIKTSSYIRIHPKSSITDAKLCGHYVNGILGTLELRGTKYHESLFLDYQGFVAEGAGENLFIVKNNKIYTPSLGNILAGITRSTIIEILEDLNYEVIETKITENDIYNADEAFFTGTAVEVTPINSLNDKIIGNGQNNITEKVRNLYFSIIRGENKKYQKFLTYV